MHRATGVPEDHHRPVLIARGLFSWRWDTFCDRVPPESAVLPAFLEPPSGFEPLTPSLREAHMASGCPD